MINIFNEFKNVFKNAIVQIAQENSCQIDEQQLERFTVEPTKDIAHGDFACNAAMVLSRNFANSPLKNPKNLAQEIIAKINDPRIEKLEIAGAGFINIFVKNDALYEIIADLLSHDFAFSNLGKGEKINLEYASPNPTGPIHVGHTRGAIYGDVLASLLGKCGYDVLKEYYINDAGGQIDSVLISTLFRYAESMFCDEVLSKSNDDGSTSFSIKHDSERSSTLLWQIISNLPIYYPGEYLKEVGNALKEKYREKLIQDLGETQGEPDLDKIKRKAIEVMNQNGARDFVINQMVTLIVKDLAALGIHHDSLFSEKKNLHDTNKIAETLEILRKQGLVYEGKLEAPKTAKGVGALPEGYSEETQTLFRSSQFGDDQDRVVKKSDGTPTYFAGDLAYIRSKFERGATKFIMPLGFDHAGYVKRLNAGVEALTDGKAQLKVILCQLVKFVKNGEPLKMSKRAGNFITAREVIDEVGADALRFIMLTRKNDAPFDFDLQKVIEQSRDNPIFYVQYAHARCCSVLRNAQSEGIIIDQKIDAKILQNLTDDSEIEIIKKIAGFERLIEMAAVNYEPHRIAFYLQELAAQFHSLWNKGSENSALKFIIKENLELTKSRLYLVSAVKLIIKTGLEVFNIKAIEEMR